MSLLENSVWFITGCSTGFGRAIAKVALDHGFRVVATAYGERILTIALDVTDKEQIAQAVRAAEDAFGAIDVLVNNAGYGYLAAVEEGEEDEIRALFDVNVFGLAAMTRAVLPGMRVRKRGWIMNITSVAGLVGNAGSGYYSASKFAVEGLSDALSKEVLPFGIKVLLVEPGPFRTDFAGRSLHQSPEIADYAGTSGARRKLTLKSDGRQLGDPIRAGKLIIAAMKAEKPPQRLVLGGQAMELAIGKLDFVRQDIENWRELSLATDYEQEVP